jgi:hypothetical protein
VALALALTPLTPVMADFPPPQTFLGNPPIEKSKPALVIRSDKSIGPSGLTERGGSVFDTRSYCSLVLDIEAMPGAKGILSVKGSATGAVEKGPQAPEADELPPLRIVDNTFTWYRRSILVPLLHDVTIFDWAPESDSSGTLYAWATAIPCGVTFPPVTEPH